MNVTQHRISVFNEFFLMGHTKLVMVYKCPVTVQWYTIRWCVLHVITFTSFLLSCFLPQEYNKDIKGWVYCLEGSSHLVRMHLPENPKQSRKSELESFFKQSFCAQHIIIIFLCSRDYPKNVSPANKCSTGQILFHRDCVSTSNSVSLTCFLFIDH